MAEQKQIYREHEPERSDQDRDFLFRRGRRENMGRQDNHGERDGRG